MKISRDDWLSDIFGYNVFRCSLTETSETSDHESLPLRMHQCEKALYYAKVPTERIDLVHTLARAGFRVVDVNVTLEWISPGRISEAKEDSIIVQEILPLHYKAVLDIAASSFVYSRFHLDPEVPNQIANTIKRAWVDNYIRKKRGEQLLVGLIRNEPVGFLAVLPATVNGEPCRIIDLVGVHKTYQRRGIGRSLVAHFIREYEKGCSSLRVGTQAANIPSLRLYENLGFRTIETTYVLHAHLPLH